MQEVIFCKLRLSCHRIIVKTLRSSLSRLGRESGKDSGGHWLPWQQWGLYYNKIISSQRRHRVRTQDELWAVQLRMCEEYQRVLGIAKNMNISVRRNLTQFTSVRAVFYCKEILFCLSNYTWFKTLRAYECYDCFKKILNSMSWYADIKIN